MQAAQDGVVGPGQIMPGTIAAAAFASTIRPVILVSGALPTLPDPSYPEGTFVYKTDDSPPRLYKVQSAAWVAAVGPDDIQANSITAGQIAAGAVSTSELAVGAHLTGEVSNSGGEVLIDASGLTILNGMLTLQDEFGVSSAVGSGFSGGWADFVRTNLYNSSFRSGTVGSVPAGRTSALPYWTVAYTNASVAYVSADITVSLGASTGDASFTSDRVRVPSGGRIVVLGRYSKGLASTAVSFEVVEYDAAGSTIATTTVHFNGSSAGTFRVRSAQLVLNDATVEAAVRLKAVRSVAGSDTVHFFAVSLSSVDALFDPAIASRSGSDLALTTSLAVAGVSVAHDSERGYVVIGHFDFEVTVSGVGACVGGLFVNGGSYGASAIYSPATTGRASVSQVWYVPAGTVSSGGFQLVVQKTAAGGAAALKVTHSTILAIPVA